MRFLGFRKISLSQEEKLKRKKNRVLAITSGVLLGLSFPPFPFPYLTFAALVPYFFALNRLEKLIDINKVTYTTAFFFGLITIFWVGGWEDATDKFLMIAGGLLLFINPIFFLIPSILFYYAKKSFNKKIAFLLFPFFWVSYEYFYMITDASFPWLTLGNSLSYFKTFIQIADTIGVLGLSLILIFTNIFLFFLMDIYFRQKQINLKYLTAIILLIILPLLYGSYKITSYRESQNLLRTGIIQPNLNPWDKWETGGLDKILSLYLSLSDSALKSSPSMLVWPETALPIYLLSDVHYGTRDKIVRYVLENGVVILTGMPDIYYFSDKSKAPNDAKQRDGIGYSYATYNSALLFNYSMTEIQRYGKMKLVPFSERVPFVDFLPFLGDLIKWEVGISGWNVGKEQKVFTAVFEKKNLRTVGDNLFDTVKIAPLICYESIYPDFTANFVEKGAQLICVVTNDSWFGKFSGPYQHKEISVLRAVENRRSVIRSANGGISCLIDPLGFTIVETEMFTKDFLIVDAPIESKISFYTKFPLLVPYLCFIASILVIIYFIYNKIKFLVLKQ